MAQRVHGLERGVVRKDLLGEGSEGSVEITKEGVVESCKFRWGHQGHQTPPSERELFDPKSRNAPVFRKTTAGEWVMAETKEGKKIVPVKPYKRTEKDGTKVTVRRHDRSTPKTSKGKGK
jgi:hypothetical protein